MSTIYELPLTGSPQQIAFFMSGVGYQFRAVYCDAPDGGWVADLMDADANVLVGGMPLVTGHDLLEQYAYLGIGFKMVVQSDSDPGAVPTFDNLGTDSHVYLVVG